MPSSTNMSELYLMKCLIVFAASQMLENSHNNPADTPCEASWNISHNTLYSGKIIFCNIFKL